MGNIQQTQNTNQGFDIGQFLQSIAQSIGRQGGMVMPNQQPQQQLNNAVTTGLSPNPQFQGLAQQYMSDSADKALTQYYDKHAQEALLHPDGIQALTSIVAQSQQQDNSGQPQTQGQPQQSQGGQQQSIPAQSLNVNQGKGMGLGGASLDQQGNVNVNMPSVLGRILFGNSLVNKDLNTIGGAQKISGQEPMQPMEKATIQGGINTATLQAMNDANTRLQNYRDQLTKEFAAEGQTIPGWTKGATRQLTPRMQEIQAQLKDINISQGQLLNSFMTYKPNNVLNKVKEINNKTPQYQVGQQVNVNGKKYTITGFKNGKHTVQEAQ